MGFPGVTAVKNPPATAGDAGDMGSIPGLGISPGGGNGNPLQYSCLENSMDRGDWWAIVHGVTENWILFLWLSIKSDPFPFKAYPIIDVTTPSSNLHTALFSLMTFILLSQAVLSLGTIDILDLESLCCVCSPVHFKMLSSIPGFYPLDVSSIPKLWQSKLFPKTNEVAQSCPTLCDPMDCNLPGSSIHGICQARVLEWAAISFSRGSSHFLLQGIIPTQGLNPGLLHYRRILYQLTYKGSPLIHYY